MAGLFRAQQIARTANFQVAHGNLEAGAELRVFADGVEPLFRDLGQDFSLAERELRIGVAARTAHAAADLVQLRKAQPVGVLDDERVDVRDINAGFNDGRADENLNFAV